MSTIAALLHKDLLLELRNKQVLALLLLLSLLLSVVLSIGIEVGGANPNTMRRVFPALWWATFVFSATLGFGKSFDYETEEGALDALLSTGVSPALLFTSKFLVNWLLSLIGQCGSLLFLAVLLNVDVGAALLPLLAVQAVVAAGYAALATLLIGISGSSGLKHLLLPLILLPLITPLFMGATELTLQLMEGRALDLGSPWVSLLVGLDVVYFLAGLNLYGVTLRE